MLKLPQEINEIRLILGDQLNQKHNWFSEKSDKVLYLMMEIRSETDYVAHHIQKITAFFLAMRSFAGLIKSSGHVMHYIKIDSVDNKQSFFENIKDLIVSHKLKKIEKFSYQEPDEFRVDQLLKEVTKKLQELDLVNNVAMVSSEHFLTTRNEFAKFFHGKKTRLMENFYRAMRVKHKILLEPDSTSKPLGGKWNFDSENRKPFKGEISPKYPKTRVNSKDVGEIVSIIEKLNIKTIDKIDQNNFIWPISREQALDSLNSFCKNHLKYFGTYQDAIDNKKPFLFHSLLSFPLNVKLISPKEVVEAAIREFNLSEGQISLSQIEGFVRQIIGWREYMRGIYWEQMPDFSDLNYFSCNKSLPNYFWNADTKMECIKGAVSSSLENAYAHHIQRLMITGAFCLLTGIDPSEVDKWYLGIYIDAIEWVELPNTRGMSQFADGGIIATKPYCSSANYISKMSNYCKNCFYNSKDRYSDNACPFNALYWDFHIRHRDKLESNHRLSMVYRNINRMPEHELVKIQKRSKHLLDSIESL